MHLPRHVPLAVKLVLLLTAFSSIPLLVTIGVFTWIHPHFFGTGSICFVLVFILTVLSAFAFARHLTRPLQALMRGIDRVSQGDLSTIVEVATRDEIHDLSQAFNRMIEEMRHYREVRVDEIVSEKAKTEGIIYSSEDGILLADDQGQIQLINPKGRDILELGEASREALAGRPIWSFVKDDRLAASLREGVESQERQVVREINLSRDGIRRYYSLSVSHIEPPEGDDVNEWSVIILRNITLEKELSQLKDDFLQSLTHDLRNPMTAIRGYIQILNDEMAGAITADQRKMLTVMENASAKLIHIISNMLDSAKVAAGKMRLTLVDVNLRRLIPSTVELMHTEAQKKKITLTLDMPEELSPLKCDPVLLERTLINLIGNAIKFTPEGGFVTVKFAEFSDRIQIQVGDTGSGIPAEFMGKLFKRFEQVNGTQGGTGLGLANCKYIVEAHYGEIIVKSKVGEGSLFTFSIPKGLQQNERGDIFRTRDSVTSKP